MTRIELTRRLRRDDRGATMVEFALIAPLFFVLTFGICEFALAYFQGKSAEKAIQLGARLAVVSNRLPGVPATNTKADPSVTFGTPCGGIGNGTCTEFATISCTSATCGGPDFDYIVARMREVFPPLLPAEVTIQYQYTGLGFVGGPTVPAVTARVNHPFDFAFLEAIVNALRGMLGGGGTALPNIDRSATLTGEDLAI